MSISLPGIYVIGNNQTLTVGDNDFIIAGSYDTISTGDNASILAGNNDTISAGDNASILVGNSDLITAGDSGQIVFGNNDVISLGAGDTIQAGNSDSITMSSGTLSNGNSDVITLAAGSSLVITNLGTGDVINAGGLSATGVAGSGLASITIDANEKVTVNGTGDTIIAGKGDYVTFGGQAGSFGGATPTKVSDTVGAGTTGATISSGLGVDTIAAGVGYQGGNTYIGSYHGDVDGANGVGSCINYSDLGTAMIDGDTVANPQAGLYTVVNLNTGVAQGYSASGKLLWTDTVVNMQQAKAANGNGDVLTANNSYYSELKGAGGTTTYYCGNNGTTIFWGWNTNVSHDIAYGNANAADLYVWRASAADPNGNDPTRPISVLGELIYNFDANQSGALNLGKGDTLNFSQVNSDWAGLSNFANWSVASDGHGGTNLVVRGIGTVVDLGKESLSSSQLTQLFNSGNLLV